MTPHLPKSPSQAPVTTEKKDSAHFRDHRFVTTHHTPQPQLPQHRFHSLHANTHTHIPVNRRLTHTSIMAVRASFENSNEYVRPRAAHGDPSPQSIHSFIACPSRRGSLIAASATIRTLWRACRCPSPEQSQALCREWTTPC